MATPIIDHNLLTLDYWQDSVTYEGKTVPGGTIGCEALNIPDTLREKLAQASIPLQKIVAAIKENNLTAELLRPAKGSVLHMIQLAKDTPPFSRADAAYYNGRVEHIFSEEGIQNTLAYVQAAAVVGLLATFNEQFRQGVGITKTITLAEELPATIRNYKSGMTAFADELHKGKRTPDGYAQVFGRIFSGQPKLSLDDKSWRHFPTQQFNMYLPSAPRKTRRSSCAGCTICLSCLCSAPICTRVYASDTRRGNAPSAENGF